MHVKVLRDAKVVHVSECFLDESCPLLGDPAHLVLLVRSHHFELHVSRTGPRAPGTNDHQGNVAISISNLKPKFMEIIGQSLLHDD